MLLLPYILCPPLSSQMQSSWGASLTSAYHLPVSPHQQGLMPGRGTRLLFPYAVAQCWADGHQSRSSPRLGWAQSTGAEAFGGPGCPYSSRKCFRDPPVTVERGPGTLAPSYATVGHDPRGAWLPQPPKALLSRRHFLPATNADHSGLL